MISDSATPGEELPAQRQRVVRVPGRSRRAQLEPVEGTEVHPLVPNVREEPRAVTGGTASGINDSRLKADRPPHW